MKRNTLILPYTEVSESQILQWAQQQQHFLLLNPNDYRLKADFSSFEKIFAVGRRAHIEVPANTDGQSRPFEQIRKFHEQHQDWLFGHLNYDLKNELEDLQSRHPAKTAFPNLHFFVPESLFFFEAHHVRLETYSDSSKIKAEILSTNLPATRPLNPVVFQAQTTKSAYLQTINSLKEHIRQGDFYEINFCQEFTAEGVSIDPLQTYQALNAMSPMPFSAFYRLKEQYAIGASPERFIKKEGRKVISQPIKGTSRRRTDPKKDAQQKAYLVNSDKEIAENMMIVDLVRNDLAQTATYGSVKVPELFKVYSFPQVHQLISTITAEQREGTHWSDIIEKAFPMGSMTGAPKISVMNHADRYENGRRELYAGTIGYITPEGDFDFNVVIRTLFYNTENHQANYWVGGAITIDSDAEAEYAECMLKAKAIQSIFKN
ncbi:anthranilate synthase component I family protein [Persicobacter psychrovividus]|uniref:Para-aminobenzoate synthase n=1 Tax=Persicobacter psychrovividus TaxID=387638 RepID=A0ABM7VEA1_9BACT|nr:para-aminobenzoate synthase [Persicobacter psychrovividus]